MTTISLWNVTQEMVYFLRNNDVFTIAHRGVTTTTDEGTFASDSTHLINVSNIKNVRSIVVDETTLTYGSDYTVDVNYNDGGTIKTQITFTSAQTGDYVITYDYGSDKIFPDFPRDDLSISNYPRIAVDVISMGSEPHGFGNKKVAVMTGIIFSIVLYDQDIQNINETLATIRDLMVENQNTFYYFNNVLPLSMGPLVEGEQRQEIMHRNLDFASSLNLERPD